MPNTLLITIGLVIGYLAAAFIERRYFAKQAHQIFSTEEEYQRAVGAHQITLAHLEALERIAQIYYGGIPGKSTPLYDMQQMLRTTIWMLEGEFPSITKETKEVVDKGRH